MLDAAHKAAGDTIHGQRVQAVIAALQPREAMIVEKQKREAEITEARANAPIVKPSW